MERMGKEITQQQIDEILEEHGASGKLNYEEFVRIFANDDVDSDSSGSLLDPSEPLKAWNISKSKLILILFFRST